MCAPESVVEDKPAVGQTKPSLPRPGRRTEPRRPLPVWEVVLLDDPRHTHEYVALMLGRLFGTPLGKGLAQAVEVDTTGRCVVARLHRELAELKRDQIRAIGDLAMPACHGSMNAVIRPLAG